jgi:hypothetical protein
VQNYVELDKQTSIFCRIFFAENWRIRNDSIFPWANIYPRIVHNMSPKSYIQEKCFVHTLMIEFVIKICKLVLNPALAARSSGVIFICEDMGSEIEARQGTCT